MPSPLLSVEQALLRRFVRPVRRVRSSPAAWFNVLNSLRNLPLTSPASGTVHLAAELSLNNLSVTTVHASRRTSPSLLCDRSRPPGGSQVGPSDLGALAGGRVPGRDESSVAEPSRGDRGRGGPGFVPSCSDTPARSVRRHPDPLLTARPARVLAVNVGLSARARPQTRVSRTGAMLHALADVFRFMSSPLSCRTRVRVRGRSPPGTSASYVGSMRIEFATA